MDKKWIKNHLVSVGHAVLAPRSRHSAPDRLTVHRTPRHTYAQVFSGETGGVVASASTLSADVKKLVKYSGNIDAATAVGQSYRGKRLKRLESKQWLLIVLVSSITVESRHWPILLVKTV